MKRLIYRLVILFLDCVVLFIIAPFIFMGYISESLLELCGIFFRWENKELRKLKGGEK